MKRSPFFHTDKFSEFFNEAGNSGEPVLFLSEFWLIVFCHQVSQLLPTFPASLVLNRKMDGNKLGKLKRKPKF